MIQAPAVSGDPLTRYRLGVAGHLDQKALLQAGLHLAAPVVVELVVVILAGQAFAVEVDQDGGVPAFAAEARRAVWETLASVTVPPEWAGQSLRIGLALEFEPPARD